eukprot:TRINITY_DN6567_c0_g2_i1.p1 TRINITY_DN6567_c0_g2~~TRINITY_DN6567_c0_g2_i1.p1  ORF type:complete len:551 (-),score=189.63 TRINITY_DN6567_c0_g2_i1:157-1809(-)
MTVLFLAVYSHETTKDNDNIADFEDSQAKYELICSRHFYLPGTEEEYQQWISWFPKLMGSEGAEESTNRTYGNIRYQFTHIGQVTIVLVSDLTSNALMDRKALQKAQECLREFIGVKVEDISDSIPEVFTIFDQIIGFNGMVNDVTVNQVGTVLKADSMNEKAQAAIKEQQERSAKDHMARKAAEIDDRKRTEQMSGVKFGSGPITSSSPASHGESTKRDMFDKDEPKTKTAHAPKAIPSATRKVATVPSVPTRKLGGMQLGKKKKGPNVASMLAEDGVKMVKLDTTHLGESTKKAVVEKKAGKVSTMPVAIEVREDIVDAECKFDGSLKRMKVNSAVYVTVNDDKYNHIHLQLADGTRTSLFDTQASPHVERGVWQESKSLVPKRALSTGSAKLVLKSRADLTEDSVCPLSVTFWPEPEEDGLSRVNIQYSLGNTLTELTNVSLSLQLPNGKEGFSVDECTGMYEIDEDETTLTWMIGDVDASNRAGTFDFAMALSEEEQDELLPVTVNFTSPQTLCDWNIATVTTESGEEVPFEVSHILRKAELNLEA